MKLAPNPAGSAGSFTFVQTLGLLLNSQSKNKDAAADFAFWVVSPEGAKIFTEAGGTSPRISVFTDPEIAASRGAWWNDYAEALKSGHGTIRDPNASQLLEALNAQISAAYAGQISPEDALKQAAQDMREILGQ
jgi:ABC-type glycerol-3-phosphate transport system substrate-binding protein